MKKLFLLCGIALGSSLFIAMDSFGAVPQISVPSHLSSERSLIRNISTKPAAVDIRIESGVTTIAPSGNLPPVTTGGARSPNVSRGDSSDHGSRYRDSSSGGWRGSRDSHQRTGNVSRFISSPAGSNVERVRQRNMERATGHRPSGTYRTN
jgi:hypothetical protein